MEGPPPVAKFDSKGLKIVTIVMGAIGMVLWGCAIGFPIGYSMQISDTIILSVLLIPINICYCYYTARIIYIITSESFPSPMDFRDVRKNCAKLVAATVPGFAGWIVATIWFAKKPTNLYDQSYETVFGCSFSFIWTVVVLSLASAYETKVSRTYYGRNGNKKSLLKSRNPLVPFDSLAPEPSQRRSSHYKAEPLPRRPDPHQQQHYDASRFPHQHKGPQRPQSSGPVYGHTSPWSIQGMDQRY